MHRLHQFHLLFQQVLQVLLVLLDQLRHTDAELERKLNAFDPAPTEAQIHLDEANFRQMLAADPMATEKLDEGIRGFCKAIESLETQLAQRLGQLEGQLEGDAALVGASAAQNQP